MMKNVMLSPKTSWVGIIGFLGITLTQVYYAFDNDPQTNLNFTAIIEALALLGVGLFSRDGDKTDESQGLDEGVQRMQALEYQEKHDR